MNERPPFRNRLDLAVGAVVVGALSALGVATRGEIQRQTDEVVAITSAERMSQLDDATSKIAADFDEVAVDLDFLIHLVDKADDRATHDTLVALLAAMTPYRLAAVYSHDCTRRLLLSDPRWTEPEPANFTEGLDRWGAATCRRGDNAVDASLPIGEGELGWYRVFSRRLPDGGAMALLVDTKTTLARLTTLTADASAELLVLGPHGQHVPVSAPRLASGIDNHASATLDAVLVSMRGGERGVTTVPPDEAAALGYPAAALVVVYAPIRGQDGAPDWSAATVYSTVALMAHERGVFARVGATAGVVGLLLVLLASYVVRSQRAQATADERMRSAEQLAHLRERAERILDHIPAGVVALGDVGVTSANETARKWGPAGATSLRDLLPQASIEALGRVDDWLRQAVETGHVQGSAAEPLALFGHEGTYSVYAVPIVPPSPDVKALLIVADLTELRRLQEQLLRFEKLSTVGILAAGIAHEIGTPLSVIRGRAELAGMKHGVDDPHAASHAVIIEQIDRITRTIRALLDFSSPRAIPVGDVVLDAPFQHVAELVRYEVEKRSVTLNVSVEPNLPHLRADPDHLQQVLINLVMNALDATPPGGTITIAARRVIEGDEPYIAITVRDTGTGIAPEHIHQVFDPFFTTKKRGQGTGLGLTIVNKIARDHGGLVRVQSEPGQGTTFEVLLPIRGGNDVASDANPRR